MKIADNNDRYWSIKDLKGWEEMATKALSEEENTSEHVGRKAEEKWGRSLVLWKPGKAEKLESWGKIHDDSISTTNKMTASQAISVPFWIAVMFWLGNLSLYCSQFEYLIHQDYCNCVRLIS